MIEKRIFDGDKDSIAWDCPDEGQCFEWYLSDFIAISDRGCQNGKIRICTAAPGGYGPFGAEQYIDQYGIHELPLWDKSYKGCIGGIGEYAVVVSVPIVTVEITRKNE